MPWDPYSQNNNGTYNNPYTPPGRYEKSTLRKLLIIALCVFAALTAIAFIARSLQQPSGQQSKYMQSATAAARKQIPDAQVRQLKVAGGFAIATVSSPSADGQAAVGNMTIFKVNKDGSMKQLANGSSFSPIDFLGFGMPLATQAKLTGTSVNKVKQNLASQCGYAGDTPGYIGFDGSFNPDGWQIDSATLSGLEQVLSDAISSQNSKAKPANAVICVNATRKNSDATTSTKTYISTFTLQAQFITANGVITTHTLTFATGPNYYREYTLDGHDIQ